MFALLPPLSSSSSIQFNPLVLGEEVCLSARDGKRGSCQEVWSTIPKPRILLYERVLLSLPSDGRKEKKDLGNRSRRKRIGILTMFIRSIAGIEFPNCPTTHARFPSSFAKEFLCSSLLFLALSKGGRETPQAKKKKKVWYGCT